MVRLPRDVEEIAGDGDRADEIIHRDVEAHAQERGLRDAVADARGEDVERDDGRGRVAKTGDETDDGVETEAPARAGDAEQSVHPTAQLIEARFDLDLLCAWARRQFCITPA